MRHLTALLFAIFAATAASAERGDVSVLFGPVTGGSFEDVDGGADLDIDNAPAVGLAWHLDAMAGGQYEILYLRQRTDIGASALFQGGDEIELDIEYLQFGGLYGLGRDSDQQWQPYAVLTIGAARYSPDAAGTESETFAAMTGGVGLRRAIGRQFNLRLEARALATWLDGGSEVFCVSAGGALCAISAEGETVWQWTALAAIGFRF